MNENIEWQKGKERHEKDTIKTRRSVLFYTHVAKYQMMRYAPNLATDCDLIT